MLLKLEKINPKFRQITDLFFLSEKTDINLSNYKSLLKLNKKAHLEYLITQFEKSSNIFLINGEKIWAFRLNFLFSLKDNSISEKVIKYIEKRFANLIKVKSSPDPKYDIEFVQFIEYCKYCKSKKQSLSSLQESFLFFAPNTNLKKLIQTAHYLIPFLFKDIQEFGNLVLSHILHSPQNFKILNELKNYDYKFNIKHIVSQINNIIFKSEPKYFQNTILSLINNIEIRSELKRQYDVSFKSEFFNFIKSCDFWLLEDKWLRNIVNLIDISPDMADDIATIYINKLYNQQYSHKMANIDRIIRLLNKCPQISKKKILLLLSSNRKMFDIKHLIIAFPELKKLAAFI